jgi:hypothetical protein
MIAALLALVTAMATKVEGTVTLSAAAKSGIVRVLKAREQIHEGETVSAPKKASVVLLCSTDRWVGVSGPRDWILDAKACAAGTPVTPGSYRELAAENGRIRSLARGVAIEIETRTDEEDELVPILLTPRNTAVVNPRPAVSWSRVPHATEYAIEWLGDGASTTRIAADKAQCNAGVCTAPYPADKPALTAGAPAFVRVKCRVGIASPWRHEQYAADVRLLDPSARESLHMRLDAIEAMPADADLRNLLIAGAYANSGVLHEAWQRYSESATPAAWVSAGDLAFQMGLPVLAVRDYTRASDTKSPASVRAAAASGLGRVALAHRLYKEAQGYFESARNGFASLNLASDAAAARAGLEEATRRLERKSQ